MATVTEDLIRGASADGGFDGGVCVRSFHVNGLATTPAKTLLLRAVDAVKEQIGQIGHPLDGAGENDRYWWYRAERFTPQPCADAKAQAFVQVVYRDMKSVRIRTTGNTSRETTRLDYTGAKAEVRFDSAITGGARPHAHPSGGVAWPAELPRWKTGCQISFERYDIGDRFEGVELWLPGKVNSDVWQGCPARCWLCTGVSGSVLDAFQELQAHEQITLRSYTFEFIGDWIDGQTDPVPGDPIAWWRDRNARVPNQNIDPKLDGWPSNNGDPVTSGNGWKVIRVQPQISFQNLELPQVLVTD